MILSTEVKPTVATQRRTPYVAVNLTVPARDELQRTSLRVSGLVERRIPMSQVLMAALAIAARHNDEFLNELQKDEEETEE